MIAIVVGEEVPVNLRLVFVVLSACLLAAACNGDDAEEALTTTTVAPTTVAPTTVAPTTVAPTTVAPTTDAPTTTTAAPTTVAPTTVADSTTSTTLAPVSYQGGATYVTGRIADFTIDEGTVTSDTDGTSQSRDGTITYTLVSNDPRVTGTVTGTWHSDRWGTPANGAITQWGEATITNENGTWQAPYSGIWTSSLGDVITRWWQGTGDYTGLTFYMAATGVSAWEWVGLIYPGTPPPQASSVQATATSPADPAAPTTLAPVSYPGGATYVTGRIADFTLDQGTVTTDTDGVTHSRGGATTYTLISNDARVAGTVTSTWNTDRWGPGPANGAFVEWGEATLTNENGTWETSHSGIYATPLGDMNARWWVGSGNLTGLTFYMAIPGETEPWEWVGLIYPGAPPPGA